MWVENGEGWLINLNAYQTVLVNGRYLKPDPAYNCPGRHMHWVEARNDDRFEPVSTDAHGEQLHYFGEDEEAAWQYLEALKQALISGVVVWTLEMQGFAEEEEVDGS